MFLARYPSQFGTFDVAFHRLAGTVAVAPPAYGLQQHFASLSGGLYLRAQEQHLRWKLQEAEKSATDMDGLDRIFFHIPDPPIAWFHRLVALREHLGRQLNVATREREAFMREHPEFCEGE